MSISETGQRVWETEIGPLAMTAPTAFQEAHGQIKEVDVAYTMEGANQYGFTVEGYDRVYHLPSIRVG